MVSEMDGDILEFQELLSVDMTGDDLRAFMNDLGLTLAEMCNLPDVDVLERLSQMQVQKHSSLKERTPSCQKLPHRPRRATL